MNDEWSTALDPLVHRLVAEIEGRRRTREGVSLEAGLGKDTIGSWARGQRTPNIGNLRAALQTMGAARARLQGLLGDGLLLYIRPGYADTDHDERVESRSYPAPY